MRRGYILTIIVLAIVIIGFFWPIVIDMSLAFIFLGLIPGTDLSVPGWIMLIIYALVFIFALRWLIRQPASIDGSDRQEKIARRHARERVVKKTTAARRRNQKPLKAKA